MKGHRSLYASTRTHILPSPLDRHDCQGCRSGSDQGIDPPWVGQRSPTLPPFVYVRADGVHFRIRLEEDRLCCLVLIGVKADGSKELLACSEGYRESADSWADVLRDLKSRGMTSPVVAVGDGALGFWAALREVFPTTREQRCWVHKTANILDALPKRLHRSVKAAIHEIYQAETRSDAEAAIDDFETSEPSIPRQSTS